MNHDDQSEMGFLDHLEELRWRLVRCLLAMVIGSAVSFGYIDHILNVLLYPARSTSNPINLQVLSVQGMFLIKWFISFISGFILALPYLIYQFWGFVAPGLKVNEKKIRLPGRILFFFVFYHGYFIRVFYSDTLFIGILQRNWSRTRGQ